MVTEKELMDVPSEDEYMADARQAIRDYREKNGLPEFDPEFDEKGPKLLIDKTRCVPPCQFYEADEKTIYGFTDEEWEREAPVNVWVNLETRAIETEVNGVIVEEKEMESDLEVLDYLNLMTPEMVFSKETPKDRLAAALRFYLYEDLTKVSDSLELDPGTEVATLSFGDCTAAVKVCGGVHNWFSIQFQDGTEWNPDDDVVDVEGQSKQEIFSLMWDALSSHLEHQRQKEEALASTVLTDFVEYLRGWAITDDDRKFADKVDYATKKFIEQTK